MTNEILQLDDIIIDNGLNPREGALDQEVILDYAAHADDLPSMRVFRLDEVEGSGTPGYYLVSGFHRIAAHRLAGRTSAHFIVHVGTMEEAKEFADLDNLKHGLRLSRAERRAVIERQLKRHPDWSDTRLALACSTSDKTVRTVREELEANLGIPRFDVLVGSDGIARPRTVSRAGLLDAAERGQQQATFEYPNLLLAAADTDEDDAADLAELEQLEAEERAAAERDAGLLGEAPPDPFDTLKARLTPIGPPTADPFLGPTPTEAPLPYRQTPPRSGDGRRPGSNRALYDF